MGKNKKYVYKCSECKQIFKTKASANKHVVEEHFFDHIVQTSVDKKYRFEL